MHINNNQFSSRENETVDLLLQGKSNKQIAVALGVSVSTVEFHLKNIYRKLQVNSRTEAILRLGESTGRDQASKLGQSIGSTADKPWESTVDGTGVDAENSGNTISTRRFPMKQMSYTILGGSLLAITFAAAFIFARLNTIKAYYSLTPTMEIFETAVPLMSNMGTSFIFPPGLGDGTQNEIVPQSSEFMIWPKHVKLTLVDYPIEGTSFQPQIMVFPADEFAQMDDCSETTISALKNIVTTQRIALAEPLPCVSAADSLPFLPDEHAGQVFHAQEELLSFQNGTGIRYITQLSQAAFPAINNADMFYTFQGLTSDGKYYVSVILPINLADLPAVDDPNAFQHPADWQNSEKYPDYLKTMLDKFNQADTPFNPSLESLDALAQSLLIAGQQ